MCTFFMSTFMGNMSSVIKTGLSKPLKNVSLFVSGGLFLNPSITSKVTLTLKMFYQNLHDHAKYTNLRGEAAALPILAKPFAI